jgi:hypothetical protein
MTKRIQVFFAIPLLVCGCSTLDQSLKLGGGLGLASGVAATYARGSGHPGKNLAIGAGVGLGVGLLTSYLVHRQVALEREDFEADQLEMHFGDLPPSPFLIPKSMQKGGKR